MENIDVIVLAGEKEGSIPVMGQNKALLTLDGCPLIGHVIRALDRARTVRSITVVGPKDKLDPVISVIEADKSLKLVDQGTNIFENLWRGVTAVIPEIRLDMSSDEMAESPYADRAFMAVMCDVPMLHPAEIDHFVHTAPLDRADLVFGVTRLEMLRPYEPTSVDPGIKFIYICVREKIFRHANLLMFRPLRMATAMREYMPSAYGMRYQRHAKNQLKVLGQVIRHALFPGAFATFFLVQAASFCHNRGLYRLRDVVRRPMGLAWGERQASRAISTRFAVHETAGPGPTLDVDDEQSFHAFQAMYDKWKNLQIEQLQESGALPGE